MMLRKEQKGWLGIDLGAASVKVAQVARAEGRLRVVASAQVSRPAGDATGENDSAEPLWSSSGEIRTAVALGKAFRGRHAAVSMPMGCCDVHLLNDFEIDEHNLVDDVRRAIETVTQYSADHLEFDVWPANSASQRSWNVLAVARPWADRIYRDVIECGYACHTIDGVPQALARAVELSEGRAASPVAVLDWGFSQATFCLVAEGQPVYVRTLKDCSYHETLARVSRELGITLDEASLLMELHGVRGLSAKSDNEVVAMIAELVTDPIRALEQELSRTLSHVGNQHRSLVPRQLCLFGGGALVSGLPQYLTRKLRLATRRWSIDDNDPDPARRDPLFAVAIALSALAWEDE